MNLWLLLMVFAVPLVAGCVLGVWGWWKPRHDLDRLFAERRAERTALAHITPIVAVELVAA